VYSKRGEVAKSSYCFNTEADRFQLISPVARPMNFQGEGLQISAVVLTLVHIPQEHPRLVRKILY